MNAVLLASRTIFGLIFVTSGIKHFAKVEAMTGYSKFKNVPAAKFSVLLSGLILFFGGISVILGIFADLGALLLSGLLAIIALKMHDFWNQSDPQVKQTESVGFWKDISLAGSALFFFAITATANSDYGWTLTESLFSIKR
jgi:uncharacterized membrane protein YphA (DoxX/SURF4 family)